MEFIKLKTTLIDFYPSKPKSNNPGVAGVALLIKCVCLLII
jgi:hypothetical protein